MARGHSRLGRPRPNGAASLYSSRNSYGWSLGGAGRTRAGTGAGSGWGATSTSFGRWRRRSCRSGGRRRRTGLTGGSASSSSRKGSSGCSESGNLRLCGTRRGGGILTGSTSPYPTFAPITTCSRSPRVSVSIWTRAPMWRWPATWSTAATGSISARATSGRGPSSEGNELRAAIFHSKFGTTEPNTRTSRNSGTGSSRGPTPQGRNRRRSSTWASCSASSTRFYWRGGRHFQRNWSILSSTKGHLWRSWSIC